MWQSLHSSPPPQLTADTRQNFTCLLWWGGADNLPGFDEEPVLDEHGDEEEHHTLHGHGKEVSSHQVPWQRGHKAILTCEGKKCTVTFPEQWEQATISSCRAHQVRQCGHWRAISERREGIGYTNSGCIHTSCCSTVGGGQLLLAEGDVGPENPAWQRIVGPPSHEAQDSGLAFASQKKIK